MMNKLPVVEMVELNNHIVSCDTFQNRFCSLYCSTEQLCYDYAHACDATGTY